MTLIAKLHPLLIHFPIAFVLGAAGAELLVLVTGNRRWRTVAASNLLAAAVLSPMAAFTGWRLAVDAGLDSATLLEWHRWCGVAGAVMTLVAGGSALRAGSSDAWTYRLTLSAATALVVVTAHLGGLLVWGPDFFSR